jgi:hypothetical protein
MLFLFSTMYVISGPAITLYHRARKPAKTIIPTMNSAPKKIEKSFEGEL